MGVDISGSFKEQGCSCTEEIEEDSLRERVRGWQKLDKRIRFVLHMLRVRLQWAIRWVVLTIIRFNPS